ncbi:hypothetical protein ACRQV7_02335 [Caproiciproducens sp. R2]|uniref:hypothetical protein n=1 Tax=Caproiciproducens sp. R2 TaxID=3435187 RepID=UPI004033353D
MMSALPIAKVHSRHKDRFLREQPAELDAYDESLVRRLIEKATVYENKFTVEFKSGGTVDAIS